MILADLKLCSEAEKLVLDFSHPPHPGKPFAIFQATDISDWAQITTLWEFALERFPCIDVVVNGAGIYEPPSSTFWNAPGVSALSQDRPDQNPGVYRTFAVNTIGPIRLSQIAIDYWLEHRQIQGNLLWVASVGGYVHSMQTPLYYASKAAIGKYAPRIALSKSSKIQTNS